VEDALAGRGITARADRERLGGIRASAGLTQTKRMSVPRKAIPAGASRSTASGSQDSNPSNLASRCFGTDVSALI